MLSYRLQKPKEEIKLKITKNVTTIVGFSYQLLKICTNASLSGKDFKSKENPTFTQEQHSIVQL